MSDVLYSSTIFPLNLLDIAFWCPLWATAGTFSSDRVRTSPHTGWCSRGRMSRPPCQGIEPRCSCNCRTAWISISTFVACKRHWPCSQTSSSLLGSAGTLPGHSSCRKIWRVWSWAPWPWQTSSSCSACSCFYPAHHVYSVQKEFRESLGPKFPHSQCQFPFFSLLSTWGFHGDLVQACQYSGMVDRWYFFST